MKKINIVIVGFGGHSRVILNILERDYKDYYKILGYIDKEKKDSSLKYLGNDDSLIKIYRKGISENVIMGMGKISLDSRRERIIQNLLEIGFNFPQVISKKAIINKDVVIGNGAQILDNVVINCNSTIGKFCIVNTSTVIEHDVFIDDYTHIGPNAVICGGTGIGKSCFIGANSTVIQNINIVDDVLIGAGSVVVKDIKKSGVYAGVPARKLKV